MPSIPHFPAGPLPNTSHPLFLLKASLPNALRLSCFMARERRRGVLSRWRSDSSSWEICGGVAQCRLPSALLLQLCGEITRKGRRFLTTGPVDTFICKFTPCLFFFHLGVHSPTGSQQCSLPLEEIWNQFLDFAWHF